LHKLGIEAHAYAHYTSLPCLAYGETASNELVASGELQCAAGSLAACDCHDRLAQTSVTVCDKL